MNTPIDRLFDIAFTPTREPKSEAYRRGVRNALAFHVLGTAVSCPFPQATAAADAFFAGIQEGNLIYRQQSHSGGWL